MDEKREGEQQSQTQNPIDDISKNKIDNGATPDALADQPSNDMPYKSASNDLKIETIDETTSTKKDFFQAMSFWSAVIIGFVLTLLNMLYGLGMVLFIICLVVLSNRENKTAMKGLAIGFFSIFGLLLLACGTCFIGGAFF